MPDMGADGTRGAAAREPHEAPLEGRAGVRIAGDIAVRELDLGDGAVLDALLVDIQREHGAGNIAARVPYKGKHPARWWATLYPPSLEPVALGAFVGGQLAGWVTAMRLLADPARVQVGVIVREGWRDKGLGTALLRHVSRYKAVFHGPAITGVLFATLASNARMQRVAAKIGSTRIDVPSPGGDPGGHMLFFTA